MSKALLALLLLTSSAMAGESWTVVSKEMVVEVVTTRDDGEERITKIWIVVADGRAFVRATSWSGWFEDLGRNPQARIRTPEAEVRATARPVTSPEDRELVDRAYRAKYPTYRYWSALGLAPPNVFQLSSPSD